MSKKNFLTLLSFTLLLLSACVRTEVEVNGSITGCVREFETARSIRDCILRLEPGNYEIISAQEGHYNFTGLEMGDYTLTASKKGYCSLVEKITISAGKTLNHDVILVPAISPLVSTDSVTNLMATTATIYGTIVNVGGVAIIAKGFYFGEDSTNLKKIFVSDSATIIKYDITDLQDNKKYYFQTFAINDIGEGKGEILSFITPKLYLPMVRTSEVSSLGTQSATLNGEITDKGNCDILLCGFYLGLTSVPNQKYTYYAKDSTILSMDINRLQSNTSYFYCIFAENQKGESKGEVKMFKTFDTSKPKVITNMATNILAESAVLNATIMDEGGCELKEYGFYIGSSLTNMEKQKVTNLSGNVFSYEYNKLTDGTTYYFKAFTTNEKGESTGDLLSFQTVKLADVELMTSMATNISYTSADLNAIFLSYGSGNIQEYGFYYGTSIEPTNKVVVGADTTRKFVYHLTGILANTKYYFKAYAKDKRKETIGDIIDFTTLPYSIPQVQTKTTSSITTNSAICKGLIVSNGGISIVEQGVCYSTSNSPTIDNMYVTSSTSSNDISCSLTTLEHNTTYYYRAFARNNMGVAYGAEMNFTTKDIDYGEELTGVFSVSSLNKVVFSGGNLKYMSSTKTLQFAKHQYDYLGANNKNGWIDMFDWGTGDNPASQNYSGIFKDWGNNSIQGVTGNWYTLSCSEWNYLLKSRVNASQLYSLCTVNGIYGLILLPDNWELPYGLSFVVDQKNCKTNSYSILEWEYMEKAGAVFLPGAGYVNSSLDNAYQGVGSGYYWTSDRGSKFIDVYSSAFMFVSSNIGCNNFPRYDDASVRLVKKVP